MNALTLEWHDAGQNKTQKIYQQQPSKNPGTVRIGRDPLRCDIVVSNPTVSGLHVEIFFHPQQQRFYLKNLREQNPPLVDGQQLLQGEKPLNQGSIIHLGQMEFNVTAISLPAVSNVPATILAPPQPSKPPTPQKQVYGLQCPKCHKTSLYEHQHLPCRWCGTSLAAAASILMTPNN